MDLTVLACFYRYTYTYFLQVFSKFVYVRVPSGGAGAGAARPPPGRFPGELAWAPLAWRAAGEEPEGRGGAAGRAVGQSPSSALALAPAVSALLPNLRTYPASL